MRISRASAGCAEGENNAVTAPWSDPHGEIKQLLRGFFLSGFGTEDVSSGSRDLLSQDPLQTWFRAVWYLSV